MMEILGCEREHERVQSIANLQEIKHRHALMASSTAKSATLRSFKHHRIILVILLHRLHYCCKAETTHTCYSRKAEDCCTMIEQHVTVPDVYCRDQGTATHKDNNVMRRNPNHLSFKTSYLPHQKNMFRYTCKQCGVSALTTDGVKRKIC